MPGLVLSWESSLRSSFLDRNLSFSLDCDSVSNMSFMLVLCGEKESDAVLVGALADQGHRVEVDVVP